MNPAAPIAVPAVPPEPRDGGAHLFRDIADSLPEQLAYFDRNVVCRFANKRYAEFYGYTTQAIVGVAARAIVGEAVWQEISDKVERAIRGERVNYLRQHPTADGSVRMVDVTLAPHFDAAGEHLGALVVVRDVTQRWEAERAVRESEDRTRRFAEVTEEAIAFHAQGVVLDCNEAMARLVGYGMHELLGRNIFEFIAPASRARALEYAHSDSEHLYEVDILHKDGHAIPVEVKGKTMPQDGASYRVVVAHDISARKHTQARDAFLAQHDALTELLNRQSLLEQLGWALTQARHAPTAQQTELAVLFINLDHFKTINDSLGHLVGDQILCASAERLRACVAERGLVARPGGDDFVVVLPGADRAQASRMAQDIAAALAQPLTVADTSVCVPASIGISLFPQDEQTPLGLLRQAEAALRHAKDSGRGNQQFSAPGMAGQAMAALQLQRDLHSALENGQFVLHYQPIINLADGALAGFEALVRWQHPARGLLEPGEFIAFAETHGLISPIGRWVMHEACRQLRVWHSAGLARVPVAVNLSAFEFRQRDVASDIAAVLAQTGLAPQFLEIELTETVLMQHSDQVLQTLQSIKALGVGLAMDDFGTGYSSFSYLKRYPLDKLKIDRSFVMDTPDSSEDVAIVSAIIELGWNLKLRTVAEGVETPAQQALLTRLGCTLAQGYGIAPPMDAAQASAWLEQRARSQ